MKKVAAKKNDAVDAVLDRLREENSYALLADGFENALVGICYRAGQPPLAAYDIEACLGILVMNGMGQEEAEEYFHYNTLGSWLGENTPVFMSFPKRLK